MTEEKLEDQLKALLAEQEAALSDMSLPDLLIELHGFTSGVLASMSDVYRLSRMRAAVSRLRTLSEENGRREAALREEPVEGFWREVVGGKWTWLSEEGRKRGKHGLAHYTHVKALLERLKETDPLGADTLATLVFWRDIEAEREKFAWEMVNEWRDKCHAAEARASLTQTEGEG